MVKLYNVDKAVIGIARDELKENKKDFISLVIILSLFMLVALIFIGLTINLGSVIKEDINAKYSETEFEIKHSDIKVLDKISTSEIKEINVDFIDAYSLLDNSELCKDKYCVSTTGKILYKYNNSFNYDLAIGRNIATKLKVNIEDSVIVNDTEFKVGKIINDDEYYLNAEVAIAMLKQNNIKETAAIRIKLTNVFEYEDVEFYLKNLGIILATDNDVCSKIDQTNIIIKGLHIFSALSIILCLFVFNSFIKIYIIRREHYYRMLEILGMSKKRIRYIIYTIAIVIGSMSYLIALGGYVVISNYISNYIVNIMHYSILDLSIPIWAITLLGALLLILIVLIIYLFNRKRDYQFQYEWEDE
ncbi:MAG: FtsX-like permease family protein [Erysipelotrichaceae bacterium]